MLLLLLLVVLALLVVMLMLHRDGALIHVAGSRYLSSRGSMSGYPYWSQPHRLVIHH